MDSDDQNDRERDEPIGFDQVFQTELRQVQARWDAVYEDPRRAERQVAEREVPTTEHGLVGLGLSGGGIRSATFNLGVVQSLVRRGVFEHIDYMSTVSGGGYLGSAISAGMAGKGAEFPYPYVSGPRESPGVTWLRNHSKYLASRGGIDWLRMVAVLVRGIVLDILIIAPLLIAVALFFTWLYDDLLLRWHAHGIDHSQGFRYTSWLALGTLVYFVACAPMVALFSAGRAVGTGPASSLTVRDRYELTYAWLVLALLLVAAVEALPVLLHGYHRLLQSPVDRDLIAAAGSVASLAAGAAAGDLSPRATSFLRISILYFLGGIGLLLPLLIVLVTAENLVYFEGALHDLSGALNIDSALLAGGVMVGIWLFCRLFIDINQTSMHGLYRDRLATAYRVGRHEPHDAGRGASGVRQDLPLSQLCAPGSTAPYHLVNTTLNLQGSRDPNIRERLASHFILSKEYVGGEHTGYALTRDLEEVHPHITLAGGMAISAAAASPNMGSYTVSSLRALMVLFNVRLGYWLPNPAALTPWAAREKRPWLEPERATSGRLWRRLRWSLPPRMLIAEMLGQVHARGRFVNLSDGGHLENLGTIELLRRRMKYIIVGDGEADPKHQFRGLAVLMRQARLDLGIEIQIRLTDVCLGDDGTCAAHAALGRIVYPPRTPGEQAEDGWLLYIKLSVTGDEDETIRHYRAENPDFPHQSTADQFFDEGQFEAYRALGFHTAEQLFAPLAPDPGRRVTSFADLEAWFRELQGASGRVSDHASSRAERALSPSVEPR